MTSTSSSTASAGDNPSTSSNVSMGSMCIFVKEHGKQLCEKVQNLRSHTNLVDLDIVCEDAHVHVHKVIMAASSKFFKEHLCKANVRAPVILKLEDFDLNLKREAVSYLVEFIYKGEVVIPGDLLSPVCEAAHCLGVHGLVDFLPSPAKKRPPTSVQETQSETQLSNNAEAVQPARQESQAQPAQVEQVQTTTQLFTSNSNSSSNADSATHFAPAAMVQQQPHPDPQQHHHHQGNNQQFGIGYKSMYNNYSDNYVQQDNVIVDLESNSGDGQITEAVHHHPRSKGKLRIINQPGIITENIQDSSSELKGGNSQQPHETTAAAAAAAAATNSFWTAPNTNASLLVAPFDPQSSFDMETNMSWYGGGGGGQYNYNEAVETAASCSWTTPAATSNAWTASNSEVPMQSWTTTTTTANLQEQHQIYYHQSGHPDIQSQDTHQDHGEEEEEEAEKVKMRPPPPLLPKGGNMFAIRSGGPPMKAATAAASSKRPELEVRKDLTLPTAPTAREDNVFQPDEDLTVVLEIDSVEDEDSLKVGGKKFLCLECSMTFSNNNQLRSHVRHAHKPPKEEAEDTLLFCPVCKKTVLRGLESLKVHLYKSHGIGEVFRCEDCIFETSIKSNYVKHLATHTTETSKKLRICSKCGKAFKSRCGLKLHLQKHDEEALHNVSCFLK
jgi:hypothetical protein